jgi:hypothetical protein
MSQTKASQEEKIGAYLSNFFTTEVTKKGNWNAIGVMCLKTLKAQ